MNKYLAELLKQNKQLRAQVLDLASGVSFNQRTQRQRDEDCFIIAMEHIELDPEIGNKLFREYLIIQKEIEETAVQDYKEDKQFWFTKDKVDRVLQKYCEMAKLPFKPWEERYKPHE